MQYVPGLDTQLGPAIQQFMQGLNHAIDPNYEMRENVKKQIAINPELLQNLANAEAKTPGTLHALGLGKIGEVVAKTPADLKTQDEIENRLQILEGAKSQRAAGIATNKVTTQKAAATSKALDDPTTAKEAGNVGALGMTSWEMSSQEQKAEYAKFTKQILTDGTPITIKKLKDGTYTPQQLIGIFNSPLGEGLKMMVAADEEKARRSLMYRQLGAENAMERLKEAQAFKLFQDTRTASPEAFLSLMKNPARAKELAANPELAKTPEDKAILEAQQGIDHLSAVDRVKQNSDVRKNIEAAGASLRSIKPNDPNADALRAAAVSDLNSAFENRSIILGAPKFKAEYKKVERSFWPDSREVIYTDESGKAVPEGTALNGFNSSPEFEQTMSMVMADLQKANALGPQAYMDALNTIRSKNPQIYAAVLARSTAARSR